MEVADATLPRDRTSKKRLYARAAIQVYWITNLAEQQIEVYTSPSGSADEPDYQQRHDYAIDASIPLIIDEQEIGHLSVRDLLP